MLLTVRQRRELPSSYGVRVTAGVDRGGQDVRLSFAAEPDVDDVVTTEHGLRFFVSDRDRERLANVEIDATSTDDGTALRLVVRTQGVRL